MQVRESSANPLSRISLDAPTWMAPALFVGGRLAGVAIALFIATDESYNRTQVMAAGLVIVVLLSLVAWRGTVRDAAAAFGCGLLFFTGAALGREAPAAGIAMIASGAAAAAGVFMASRREDRPPYVPVAGFFVALPALIASVAAVALAVEG